MKADFILLTLLCQQYQAHGYQCYSCSAFRYFGEPARREVCYDDVKQDNNTCDVLGTDKMKSCRTRIEISEGLPKDIQRLCASSPSDLATCSSTSEQNFTCIYDCNKEKCNEQSTKLVKVCPNNCSYSVTAITGGYCDYLTGKCHCNFGYTGTDCSVRIVISCIQCTQEMEQNCGKAASGLPQGMKCSSPIDKCVTSKTTTIAVGGKIIREAVTRGCTSEVRFGCTLKTISHRPPLPNYAQYTCEETCDTDNCNNGIPSDNSPIYCLQCKGVDNCNATESKACYVGQKYCYSTVEYLVGKNATTQYKLLWREHGCSATTIPFTGCTSEPVTGLPIDRITCHENCETDGCNTGWPTRPKCVQCEGDVKDSSCYKKVAKDATPCPYPYQAHCLKHTVNVSGTSNTGSNVLCNAVSDAVCNAGSGTIALYCAQNPVYERCNTTTKAGEKTKECIGSCTKDGCNHGSMPSANLFLLLISYLAVIFW